jgi:glycogen(starch) synthase
MPMTRPRLVLTTDAVGGVWTYTSDLAQELASTGWDVHVLSLGPQPSIGAQQALAGVPGVELSMIDLPLDWMACDAATLHEASRTLFAIIRNLAPDIVHLNSPGLAPAVPSGLPLVIGMHSCLASWWRAVKAGEALPEDFCWRTDRVRLALASADAVIAPSRAFAQEVRSIYGANLPLHSIANGRRATPSTCGDAGRSGVLATGRLWDEGKNIALLDRAARLSGLPIRVAGQTKAPDGGVSAAFPALQTLGYLDADTVRRELERMAIFVSPALYEPFGLGVLEAAQAGCALLLADIATFRELWGCAAVFFDPSDPRDLARRLQALDASEETRTDLAQAARQRAQRFSAAAMADQTAALYNRLLARRAIPLELSA